ncbi:MAG: CBS domain-containing protein, partial [Sulfurovum sp.]|nr:CBS domain-containing protein [Sulfurovum sp.]
MITLLERLKSHVPFSLLNDQQHRIVEEHAQIVYYPKDTCLIAAGSEPAHLYYIIKGVVEARSDEEMTDLYHEDDTFGGMEIIEHKPSKQNYIVIEELICYEISKEIFLQLIEANKVFKDYFFSSIVERIEMIKENKENTKMAELMVARIDESILHELCIVEANMPVLDAIGKLEQEKATALLVKNEDGYGIVTDTDLRKYILYHEEKDLETIGQIQTFPVISVQEDELLFNVLLLTTGRSIKHLPVRDEAHKPIGILTLIDLLSYFSNQSHLISTQIEKATDLDGVIEAARRIDVMIHTLHAKGIKSRYIARLVSELHKKMYVRLFKMIFPQSWHTRCTL